MLSSSFPIHSGRVHALGHATIYRDPEACSPRDETAASGVAGTDEPVCSLADRVYPSEEHVAFGEARGARVGSHQRLAAALGQSRGFEIDM